MKKLLLVLGASVLVLSACHKATEDSVTSPSTPKDQQTKEVTNYFHYLADSYQKALAHEKEAKDTTVQSPVSATVVAMEELQLSNPTDQALIMKNYSDFKKLIQYNTIPKSGRKSLQAGLLLWGSPIIDWSIEILTKKMNSSKK